jgi:hypothetical protein
MIILLSGKQGAGKTQLAKLLSQSLPQLAIFKFADPLYKLHDIIFKTLQDEYGVTITPPQNHNKSTTIDAKLLQVLGTDWGRATYGGRFWADIAASRVHHAACDLALFDDLRFMEEIEAFPPHKRITVRLNAPETVRFRRAEKWRDLTNHASEVSLDDYTGWDLVFDTSAEGSLEDACRIVIKHLNTLQG